MKKGLKTLCLASLMVVAFSTASCDGKRPEKGYLTDEQVLEIISNFDTNVSYSKFHVVGTLNYLGVPEEQVPRTVDRNRPFAESPLTFNPKQTNPTTSSYFLNVPLHLNIYNWTADDENPVLPEAEVAKTLSEETNVLASKIRRNGTSESVKSSEETSDSGLQTKVYYSTKYHLEAKLIRNAEETPKIYYYAGEDGGLVVKTFAENKKIIINNPTFIECRAKWNTTIVYNKHGYIVSEKFETINSHKDPDSETCYGQATYEFL